MRNNFQDPNESPEGRPLLAKAKVALEEHKLDVTKKWLSLVIAQIDDLATLESFPTQESIRTSVDLLEGLAAALHDDELLKGFEPGGRFYQQATVLGSIAGREGRSLVSLANNLLSFENAIWETLVKALRREDRQLLELVIRLRTGLHGVITAATEAFHFDSASELQLLAHTDSLTGLYNRRYLIQELERHVEIFKRYHRPFSLLMLDLDNLKWLNDQYGHSAGDAALKHLATLVRLNVRDVDIPCRFGGDEFIVLMPETSKDVVQVVGHRIAESLYKTKLKIRNALVTLHVSTGSSSCPEDGREPEELLQEVDASLYRAKQGRPKGSNSLK